MGVDLYTCSGCNEAHTEYDGNPLFNCWCERWVCYNCLDDKSPFRKIYDEGVISDDEKTKMRNENHCPFCKAEDKILILIEQVKKAKIKKALKEDIITLLLKIK